MPSGFSIDRRAIAKMKKELEREFNRGGGIRVGVQADSDGLTHAAAIGGVVNNYNGPTVISSGDGAQIAFGDNSTQNQSTEQVTPGFESLAEAVGVALQTLAALPLDEEDQIDATSAGTDLLAEVTKPEPDRSIIRRGLTMLKGFLAPIAMGATTGVGAAVSVESQEMAQHALELLQSTL